MINNEIRSASLWRNHFLAFHQLSFIRHIYVLSFALIAVSLLYLVAANWFMLPNLVQLAIPQLLLLSIALISMYVKPDYLIQSLHGFCGLMIGLSLAVIGQVYQTGADSYLLFTIWAVFLLPWLYRENIGVFFLLSIITQLALYLGFKQTFWMQEAEGWYFILIHVLTTFQFYFCLKFYPALRYIFLAWVAVLSAWMMLRFLGEDGGIYFVLSLALPLLYFGYFFKHKQMLASSLTLVSIGVNVTFWIIENVGQILGVIGIEIFFIYALIIFAWFTLISYALMKLLPNNRFYILPLAVGAWIAGVLLSNAILTFWGIFSLIMGLIFVVVGSVLLKKKQGSFIRQLAYCLLLSGQVAFLGHLFDQTQEMVLLVLFQLPLLALFFYLKVHWFFLFIQLLASYALLIAGIFDLNQQMSLGQSAFHEMLIICNYLFFALFFIFGDLKDIRYHRSVMATLLFICIVSHFIHYVAINWLGSELLSITLANLILPIVWIILCFSKFLFKQINIIASIVICMFASILIYINTFEIFIIVCILSWAIQQKDKIIYALALVVFTFLLWHLYYSLELTFLVKSLAMLMSGLFLYVLAHILSKNQLLFTQEHHV